MLASDIMGLDLGVRTGFAYGPPGRPDSGVVILKRHDEDARIAFSNLLAFLVVRFDAGTPRLVAKERAINLAATRGPFDVRMMYGLHAIVEAVCDRYRVPCHDGADSTVRKHFTGRGRYGDRKLTNAHVVRRCRQLGYMAPDDADEDRANACAVWDWAAATLARAPPAVLTLFPPQTDPQPARRRRST